MNLKIAIILRKISRSAFIIGTLSLVLGFILSFMNIPASAASGELADIRSGPRELNQINACELGFTCQTPGCNPDPSYSWDAPSGYYICEIAINYGEWLFFTSDDCVDVNGDGTCDYRAGGLSTGTGEAERVCDDCDPMIGVKFYIDGLPPPPVTPTNTSVVPSSTPTNTSVAPSQTPTNTSVVPSSTPTNTSVAPSQTPTNTSVSPSQTPTNTPVAATNTPTLTGTPSTSTDTPTSTSLPSATSTSTPLATVTGNPTSTGTVAATSTATSTATATQTQVAATVTGTPPTETPELPPTMPPPSGGLTTPALVPVTGADLTASGGQSNVFSGLLINLGMGMIGLALVLQGVGKRLSVQ